MAKKPNKPHQPHKPHQPKPGPVTYVMEDIREMERLAVAQPYTADSYLDAQLREYAHLVGHPNPYYKLYWLIAQEYQPVNVVELGAYRGNGAAAFASGCTFTNAVTIDIHREDKDAQARCKAIAARYHNLFYINAWTWDAVHNVEQSFSPIDVLVIDAWHEYQYAMREWELYSRLLADEALVICDDIMDAPGATVEMVRFWDEITGTPQCKWKFVSGDAHSGVPMGFMRWVRDS